MQLRELKIGKKVEVIKMKGVMKNKVILPAILLSVLASACTQDSEKLEELGAIQASIMESSSRTYLDNGKVIWKSGDAISVFIKTGYHHCYNLSSGAGTATATFSPGGEVGDCSAREDYHYAIYPFSQNHVLTDNTVSVDLSSWATQNYTEGTFEDDQSFMTGKSSNTTFNFYNAHSMARVNLSSVVAGSYSISSVSFTSQSAALNGKAEIDMTAERPVVVCTETNDESCHTNTLVCSSKVVLTDKATEFYILMPSGTYSDLVLTVTGVNEMEGTELSWSKTYNEDITFSRSVIETFNHQFDAVDFSGEIKPD